MTSQLPDLSALVTELESGVPGLAVGGVVPGARALALAALAARGWPQELTLVVVPHVAEADEVAAGLGLLAPDLRVGVVPAELSGPYLGAEPPLAARLQAVEVMRRVAEGTLDLVIAPARVLGSPIPRPANVAAAACTISAGDPVDPAEMAVRLANAGYRRVDLVEEAGEFAVRGWVVDLHCGGDDGLRLQLDDDRVETIRHFDPGTQRGSGGATETFDVLPLDPFPADPERVLTAAAELEEEWPSLAVVMEEGAERRLWWGTLHLGGEFSNWIDVARHVVVCDRDEVFGELGRWWAVQKKEWAGLSQRSMDLPPPERLLFFRTNSDLASRRHR